MSDLNWAAIAPIAILLLAFIIWCWRDIAKNEVRYLPKWLWAVICAISIPLGGIAYLLFGRETSPIE